MERLEPKAPSEIRNYGFDWSEFLGSDTIASSVVSVVGVTLVSQSHDTTSVTIKVSGGSDGTIAEITNTITTTAGLVETQLFTLIISNAEEPVSLTEAKAQCRMAEDDSEDAFILSLIIQARSYVEKVSTYSLMPGLRSITFGQWGDYLEVYIRPVISVDTVTYTDTTGADVDYTNFLAQLGRYPLRIYPGVDDSFPGMAAGGAVTVALSLGVLDPMQPEYLIAKRAILLLIGHWFEYRETQVSGSVAPEVVFAVREMMDTLRPVSAY